MWWLGFNLSADVAAETGAVERVRPKMMTVVAIMAGLLSVMWSTGIESTGTGRARDVPIDRTKDQP
jgi:Cu/Ag efflux pump CusA